MNQEKLQKFIKFVSVNEPKFFRSPYNDVIYYCYKHGCKNCILNGWGTSIECALTNSEFEELKILYPEYFI